MSTETVQEPQSANALQIASDALDIPCTILALLVVSRVTERIIERGRLTTNPSAWAHVRLASGRGDRPARTLLAMRRRART